MNCGDRDDWMGAYACGDLDFAGECAAEEHVAACAKCREEVEGLRALTRWLPPMADPPARPAAHRLIAAAGIAAALLIGFVAGQRTLRDAPPAAVPAATTGWSVFSAEGLGFLERGAAALPPAARAEWESR